LVLTFRVLLNEITVGFNGISPSVFILERFANSDLAIFNYAGSFKIGVRSA